MNQTPPVSLKLASCIKVRVFSLHFTGNYVPVFWMFFFQKCFKLRPYFRKGGFFLVRNSC